MSGRVLIIGGGVVGLETARRLAVDGMHVTLVEAGSHFGGGCSYGNAGLIVPSYCLPIANGQALRDGIGWFFNRHGPLALAPWRDLHMATWLMRFASSARPTRVLHGARILHELASESSDLYRALNERDPNLGMRTVGWLHVYVTREGFLSGAAQAELLSKVGVSCTALNGREACQMEDLLLPGIYGAILYPDDSHLVPHIATAFIGDRGHQAGVHFLSGTEVTGFKVQSGVVATAVTSAGEISADWFVLAAGAWTGRLLRFIGRMRLPIQPATGYSVTLADRKPVPSRPLLLAEAHVVVTPMDTGARLTGGLDLLGFHGRLQPQRIDHIRRAVPDYLRNLDPSGGVEWFGYRPLSPDGLPVIGALRRFPNVVVATGHGTLGMTLAPATGRLVSEVIHERRQGSHPLVAVSPARYGL